jgi:hypothetical protein
MNEDKFLARNHCLNITPLDKQSFLIKIRSYILSKTGIWDFADLFPYSWRMYYYDHIKPIFKPQNSRLRKAIPRQWADISSLIVDVNFEFIKTFYENEYKRDIVDWNATEHHKEFANWLEKVYLYITIERRVLQKKLENSYPPAKPLEEMFKPVFDENGKKLFQMIDDGIPYHVKYAEVNKYEKIIDDTDTSILTELIKRRDYFWT